MPDSRALVDALALSPIERHSLRLSTADERKKVFTCYLAMREKISTDYLPVISSKIPFINDHTRKHLERVLSHVEEILESNFPRPSSAILDIPQGRALTWADTLILLNALVWHDIGNMYGRNGHADLVLDCFSAVSGRLYDDRLKDLISQVASAHSGEGAIERHIPDSHAVSTYQGEEVHPQFLAAVLRFADEIDEDSRRIAPNDWQHLKVDVPPENQRYWFFSGVNSSVAVRTVAGAHNLVQRVDIDSHIPSSEFSREFAFRKKRGGGFVNIKGLTEYFRRLLKLERERTYCNKYLRTAYYHPGVNGVHVRLHTYAVNARPASAPVYEFELSDSQQSDDLLASAHLVPMRAYIRQASKY
jgi:hypothetical protein